VDFPLVGYCYISRRARVVVVVVVGVVAGDRDIDDKAGKYG